MSATLEKEDKKGQKQQSEMEKRVLTNGATPDVKEEEEKGHIAHTQVAESLGLPGKMRRPIKVTIMGAGSGFTPTLVRDVLQIPGEQGGTIGLVDIDDSRLGTMHKLIQKVLDTQGKNQLESRVVRRPDKSARRHRLRHLLR